MYLEHKDLYKQDENWIFRPVWNEEPNGDKQERLGFKDNTTIMQVWNKWLWDEPDRIIKLQFENELIPVYLQAFIDTHLSVAGNANLGNLKKIYDMICYTLNHPNPTEEEKFNVRVSWRKEPLT